MVSVTAWVLPIFKSLNAYRDLAELCRSFYEILLLTVITQIISFVRFTF